MMKMKIDLYLSFVLKDFAVHNCYMFICDDQYLRVIGLADSSSQ